VTPEMGKYSNYAGYIFLVIGFFCLIIHYLISSNIEIENNDLFIQSKNYDDFNSYSNRESLNFPQSKNLQNKLNSSTK